MTLKHTPGPWTARCAKFPQDGEYDYGIFADGKVIAEAFGRVAKIDGVRPAEANAGIIAAAPDLLAALIAQQEAYDFLEAAFSGGGATKINADRIQAESEALFKRAADLRRAAIAKAEGR